ncbi:MAG: hypothetical protein HY920_06920 [Elusimicrobia bacterium]|nr:hypothetical protein [Elusimicrobiota bacterium]
MTSPKSLKVIFYEEIVLIGRVLSDHQNKDDLIFRLAKMLDWVYRRHTGQIGRFENEIIEMLLKQPYKPHLSTIYLLERHFPEIKGNEDGTELDQDARIVQPAGDWTDQRGGERVLRGTQR